MPLISNTSDSDKLVMRLRNDRLQVRTQTRHFFFPLPLHETLPPCVNSHMQLVQGFRIREIPPTPVWRRPQNGVAATVTTRNTFHVTILRISVTRLLPGNYEKHVRKGTRGVTTILVHSLPFVLPSQKSVELTRT